ncbi:MAG: ABC transporter permease [Chloroflexi bacterium]|nr:ABC transporter permease [Chloroflexota bacterium]MYE38842.1 ABC transporter permease [Chloroflexota bacterium]
MQQYIIKRVLLLIPTILLVTIIVFALIRVIPGDPALLVLVGPSGEGTFTEEQLEEMRRRLGTDRPVHEQYGVWMWGLLRGDLGDSIFYERPVTDQLGEAVPVTLELAVLGMLLSFIVAVPLGVVAALKQDTFVDHIAGLISFTGIGVPTFVVGVLIIYLLVTLFGWLPPLGYADLWSDPGKNLQQMIFPALALAFYNLAFTARVTRSSMLEVLREDYIRTARSKGLSERVVIFLHGLKNACLPVITVSGWQLARLMGGTVIIESIFLVPGMGRLLVESIFQRDYPLIQVEVLVIAAMILFVNLVVDIGYGLLDPRIRYG